MTRLDDILDAAEDAPTPLATEPAEQEVVAAEEAPAAARPGFCVECTDQPAAVHCLVCQEEFCEVCHAMLHRTGTRRMHSSESVKEEVEDVVMVSARPSCESLRRRGQALLQPSTAAATSSGANTPISAISDAESVGAVSRTGTPVSTMATTEAIVDATGIIQTGDVSFGDWISERAKYIPLRLEHEERRLLRLLEAALNVSEYTDKVDVILSANKTRRIVQQIKDICAILSGLVVASDYKTGQKLLTERDFAHNADFFQQIFEIGRRHKIMNPEKMRSAYGKLMYLLQDSMQAEVLEALEFSCVKPIKTVHAFLAARPRGLELLRDPLVATATREVIPEGKTRRQIQAEIQQKERAVESLSRKYGRSPGRARRFVMALGDEDDDDKPAELTEADVQWCLYSIADNHSYLRSNRDPCDKMIKYLTSNFHPDKPGSAREYSLAIQFGRDGARLSHSHSAQYHYVHQTLRLWREIQHEMFKLWYQADTDLLSEHGYRLRDTGQGLNRVQSCPNVSREVHAILHRAQKQVGYWIGSSVVHLGDRNVPNALMFIDKYNQVPRILNPIARCLEQLDEAAEKHPALLKYIEHVHGSVDDLRRLILADFFRSAFDGSGADNFFDAGSCIDGRLTSAWNWCSQIEKKTYYPVFLLTGFMGFDGSGFAG